MAKLLCAVGLLCIFMRYATGVRSMPKEEKEYELIQQLDEDVMASLHELNKSATTLPSPITPRVKVFGSSLEGFEDVPSGLLEKEMESTEEGCRDGYAKTKKVLGAGVYGTVYEVEKKIHEKWYKRRQRQRGFALKIPKGDRGIRSTQKEMAVLDDVGTCKGVLSMIDKSPCVDGKKMPNSYVTKMYAGDLHKWSKVTPIMTRVHCYQTVFSQVAAGLTCMHEKGWIHNDVKAANILYEGLDDKGCPEGLVLADFGISYKIGSPISPFNEEDYMSAFYIVESLFYGMKDPLKIVRSFELENGGAMLLPTAIPKIDLCSAAFMIYRIWNYKEPALQKLMGAGTCGPMGPGHTQLFP
ncbi:Cyclin-dependent kinase A-1 (CDKA [Durusdinium trenchii]|uniref:Cyclin-dependent kinase A-1 (CDKA) n=1 Tax=Durusdinium trenchii TaxID=1381693 RepID=A0ABP0SSJ4_9DINO